MNIPVIEGKIEQFLLDLRKQLIKDDVLHWKKDYRLNIVKQIDLLLDIKAINE